jgi:predicted amidohydrolase
VRVSVIQLSYGDDESLPERTDRVAGLVRAQSGADLVVLPELWPHGGFAYDTWEEGAQPLDGAVVSALRAAAREAAATVPMGSFVERDPAGRLFNTSVLLGPDGELLTTYRKVHLFGFGEGEPALMTPGEGPVVHGTLGLATCYDLRFPEMFRALLDAGAEVVLMPAAWPATRVQHWRLLAQARAVENQVYMVAGNTAGTHAGVRMGGQSLVVDPWGEVVAEAGDGEEVLVVDLDPALVASTRAAFPVLADRRL